MEPLNKYVWNHTIREMLYNGYTRDELREIAREHGVAVDVNKEAAIHNLIQSNKVVFRLAVEGKNEHNSR